MKRVPANRLSLFIGVVILTCFGVQSTARQSQSTSNAPTSSGPSRSNKPLHASSPQANEKPTPAKPEKPSIQSKLAAEVGAFSTKGDYIPCEFSRVDLLNLRPT